MTEVKSRVQLLTRESQHTLTTSRDPRELSDTLEKIAAFLPKKTNPETQTPLAEKPEHDEFIQGGHYVHFIEFLVDQLSLEWYGRFSSEERSRRLFEVFFLDGFHHHSFLVLCSAITQSRLVERIRNCWIVCILRSSCADGNPSSSLWSMTIGRMEGFNHRNYM